MQEKVERCKTELKKNFAELEEFEKDDKTYIKSISMLERELNKLNEQMSEKLSKLYTMEIEIDRLKMQKENK